MAIRLCFRQRRRRQRRRRLNPFARIADHIDHATVASYILIRNERFADQHDDDYDDQVFGRAVIASIGNECEKQTARLLAGRFFFYPEMKS